MTCCAGIVILISPDTVFGILRKNSDKIELQILAVVIRLVLGAFLIFQSETSKYPFVIEIIGWISIIAAVFLAVIGRDRFTKLMAWALSYAGSLGRISGVFALVFGAFLIHAFA